MYPRDRRRWDAVFCKLANVSVSLLISGPRMGKNQSCTIFAGPDTIAILLSSEKSFRREHHGSCANVRLSSKLNLGRRTRLSEPSSPLAGTAVFPDPQGIEVPDVPDRLFFSKSFADCYSPPGPRLQMKLMVIPVGGLIY